MRSARLEMALETGVMRLPETGQIAVYHPVQGDDLSALPKAQVRVETPFKPDFASFAAQGFAMAGAGPDELALVFLPRAKNLAYALMHRAMAALVPNGHMVLDGQKLDGIEAVLKDLKRLGLEMGEVLSKAHGKLIVVKKAEMPADWADHETEIAEGFITLPGVFSADGPDRGSILLVQALPAKLPPHMVDFGAGWGYLSRAVLARAGVKSLDLIEADARGLDCAKKNIFDARARFLWDDVTSYKPPKNWSGAVMNPPFHVTREAEPSIGMAFIRAAHRGLTPDGQLWMVANRHLPYGPLLAELFHKIEDVGGDGAFRIIRAEGPKRATRGEKSR
jgi:16S rRNA (guanine1207-N2)-methyltransferase